MPTYEYECDSCHFRFERKQRFDEEPVAMCPKCGSKSRRVIHSVPVIFKGSGFYTTDNRKGVPEPEKSKGESPGGEKEKGKKK
jgi:putative FmdB family regulatory protein